MGDVVGDRLTQAGVDQPHRWGKLVLVEIEGILTSTAPTRRGGYRSIHQDLRELAYTISARKWCRYGWCQRRAHAATLSRLKSTILCIA
jgi:hypothetical protein